jgi:predicted alpha/beta-hydrolase family hydrolase
VRGVLHRPRGDARGGLVLAHGAGGDCRAPLLVALAEAFAERGVTTLRIDLPFRQRRRGPPARGDAERDRAGLRGAVEVVGDHAPGPRWLGGHSYGGRQASLAVAETPGLAAGLLLLAYPVHPPGRPDRLRVEHLADVRVPTLFVHGTADPFGTLNEVEDARRRIPAPSALLEVAGGHDLGVARTPAPILAARIATTFLTLTLPR